MPTCNICLEHTNRTYQPPNRPRSCGCNYVVHEQCYTTWLSQSDMAYNCIICHTKVPLTDLQEVPAPTLQLKNQMKIFMYAAIFLFILHYVREIIFVSAVAAAIYYNFGPYRREIADVLVRRHLQPLWR